MTKQRRQQGDLLAKFRRRNRQSQVIGSKSWPLGSNSFCPGFRDKPITIGLHGLHRAKRTTCVIISYACLSNILFIINLIGNAIMDFVDDFSKTTIPARQRQLLGGVVIFSLTKRRLCCFSFTVFETCFPSSCSWQGQQQPQSLPVGFLLLQNKKVVTQLKLINNN